MLIFVNFINNLISKLETIKELTEELENLKQNTVESSIHESLKTQVSSKDAKIKQLKSELESK